MSKPFVCEVVRSDRVSIETTDGVQSVVVDQVVGATLTASGAGRVARVLADDDATARVESDGNEVAMVMPLSPGPGSMTVVFDQGTQTLNLLNPGGRIIETSGDVVMTCDNELVGFGNNSVLMTLMRLRNNATLDPADANYPELSNTQVPDLINSSRLNVVPNAAGTTIQSLFTTGGVANKAGWFLIIQNTGTDPAQTLTLVNQSGTGTVGGLFFGPGDYVIPAGGGVIVLFDTHVTAADDDAWIVVGI